MREPRKGDVVARKYDGRAVQHHPITQRYHCQAYPCPNITTWVYLPANSNLCEECMNKREVRREAALNEQKVARIIYANVHHLMRVNGVEAQNAYEQTARSILSAINRHDETATATIEGLRDKVEGLTCDLRMAVETAYHRGATEWTRLNYPHIYAHLNHQEARNAE